MKIKLINLLCSFIFIVVGVYSLNICMSLKYDIFLKAIIITDLNLKQRLTLGVMAFQILICVAHTMFSLLKGIALLVDFIHYIYFGSGKEIEKIFLTLDENDFIKGSYLELKNGKKVPIIISKIELKKSETQYEEETKDECQTT